MDESKLSFSDKTDGKDDFTKTGSETGKSYILRSQELVTSTENQDPVTSTESQETGASEFVPTLQWIYKEDDEFPDNQQEKDKDDSRHERTVHETPEEESVACQDIDNPDGFSAKKRKCLKSIITKWQSAKRIIKRIKFIGRKRKVENEKTFKSKTPKLFIKKKKCTFQSEEGIEIAKEEKKCSTTRLDFKGSIPRGVDSKNAKSETVMLRKLAESPTPIHETLPSTSVESKYLPKICSVQPTSLPVIPRPSAAASGVSKVRSAEEVLEHFRLHMQSKEESFDNMVTGGINDEIRNTNSLKRKRIVFDEFDEHMRKWALQKIKDNEVVLKYSIKEGKYADDIETKRNCIEKAKETQSQIDTLFDCLDENDKLKNNPKRFKGFWRSAEKVLPRSPTQSIEDLQSSRTRSIPLLKRPKEPINTIRKLFQYLYKFLAPAYENENILKKINPRRFLNYYYSYLESKQERDEEGENSRQSATSAVEEFYLSLQQCRSRVKCKIARPEIKTLEDYQNYIRDLTTAVEENLDCLYTIIPLASAIIFPLMSYLSQSHLKIIDIFTFLDEKRSNLISESSNPSRVFDNFCERYFRIR